MRVAGAEPIAATDLEGQHCYRLHRASGRSACHENECGNRSDMGWDLAATIAVAVISGYSRRHAKPAEQARVTRETRAPERWRCVFLWH